MSMSFLKERLSKWSLLLTCWLWSCSFSPGDCRPSLLPGCNAGSYLICCLTRPKGSFALFWRWVQHFLSPVIGDLSWPPGPFKDGRLWPCKDITQLSAPLDAVCCVPWISMSQVLASNLDLVLIYCWQLSSLNAFTKLRGLGELVGEYGGKEGIMSAVYVFIVIKSHTPFSNGPKFSLFCLLLLILCSPQDLELHSHYSYG